MLARSARSSSSILCRSHTRSFSITATMGRQRLNNPALFICDIQDKFRSAIYEFPKVIATTQKLVKAASILSIPIYATTQNAARLGPTVSELSKNWPPSTKEVDKTAFSMLVPEITSTLIAQSQHTSDRDTHHLTSPVSPVSVLLVGIETHICVTQTALDLLALGHKVYIIADGVSSCNAGERVVALARLAREGCVVTTSESVLFELVGDAAAKDFKAIANLVKETKESTKEAVGVFCGSGGSGAASAEGGFKL